MDVAIVADDLTGAADAAAEFAGPDQRVYVTLHAQAAMRGDVLAVDTDSRERSAGEAAVRVAETVRALASLSPRRWFKKMDSTLRGNVAAELVAFATATAAPVVLVAPAFPAQHRSYVDGTLHSDGQPIAGVPEPHDLRALLDGGRPLSLVPLSVLRSGELAIRTRLQDAPGGAIVVADAVEDADLDAIVAATEGCERAIAYAGSAGLAAALGRALGAAGVGVPPLGGDEPALYVVGSRQPVSRRQLAIAADRFGPAMVWPPDWESRGDERPIRPASASHRSLLLTTPSDPLPDPAAVAAALAGAAAALVRDAGWRRVFVTGGDLARALCDRLGISHLAVRGQVLAGVPALTALDGLPGLELVTKAGGFGDGDTLLRVEAYLSGRESR